MDLLKMFAMLEPPVMVPHPEIREYVSTGHNCARCRRYNASGKRAFWIADMWLYDATDEDVLAATLDMTKRSHKSHTGCCEACVPKIAVPRSEATPAARVVINGTLHAVIRRYGFSGGAPRLPAPTKPEPYYDNMPVARSGGDDKNDVGRLTGSSSWAVITADRIVVDEAWGEEVCHTCVM